MRELKYVIFVILFTVIVFSVVLIAVNNTYGKVELRRFNKLNNTTYTLDEWAIYQYDIRKLHPYEAVPKEVQLCQ